MLPLYVLGWKRNDENYVVFYQVFSTFLASKDNQFPMPRIIHDNSQQFIFISKHKKSVIVKIERVKFWYLVSDNKTPMNFDLPLMVICPATKCKTNGFKALRPRSIIFCASSFFHKSCSCSNQSIKFSESLFLIPCQTCGKSSYTFFSNITFIIDMHYTTHDDGGRDT